MRYFIIFGITIIISLIIIFYPKNYLMKFNDSITIDYSTITDEEKWEYTLDSDCIKISEYDQNKWIFYPNKNGTCNLTFYYDKDDNKFKYKVSYIFKIKNKEIIWKSGEALGLLDYPNPY